MPAPIQKTLLITAAIALLAVQAQAQQLCSGSGIHQSCVGKSGNNYSYSHNGAMTQAGNYAKAGRRWQQAGNAAYNKPTFGTPLATTKSVRNAQLYNGVNNSYNGINNNLQNLPK